ncbi:hypothetical protein F5B20DRAFT_542408 [Whalleya microplaca]|nr:hypothetical protein F5B20DRAFT_542408 [Whalleya microplaca]
MEISLQSAEDIKFTKIERAIFNVLKGTLQYPANPQVKGIKLADDICFFGKSIENDVHPGETIWAIWSVIIDIVYYIPPDHPWQDSLIQCLNNLRQRDGTVTGKSQSRLWKDLPNLNFCFREKWDDPTESGEELNQDFAKWKNLNSFVARLTSTDFAPWMNLPIWQLRTALEEPPERGSTMECRVWAASEWLIQCANVILDEMDSKEELDESTARAIKTGPLFDGNPPLSVERWEFWRKRLSEISNDTSSLELDSAISERISDALKSMDAVKR